LPAVKPGGARFGAFRVSFSVFAINPELYLYFRAQNVVRYNQMTYLERMVCMAFLDLAKDRYSVRKFSGNPVEKEKIGLILQAGQLAPTACNNQPQHILIAESKEARSKIRKCTHSDFGAPVIFVVCYDRAVSWKRSYDGKDEGEVDAAIVTAHMMLEAADIGLGTTWVGSFDPDAVRREFSLPDSMVPVALLPTGYPAKDAAPSSHHAERKPLEQTVSFNCL
jgi:nitroreductase